MPRRNDVANQKTPVGEQDGRGVAWGGRIRCDAAGYIGQLRDGSLMANRQGDLYNPQR